MEHTGKTAGKGRKIGVGRCEKNQGRRGVHPAGVSDKSEIYGLECHSNNTRDEADARPRSRGTVEEL